MSKSRLHFRRIAALSLCTVLAAGVLGAGDAQTRVSVREETVSILASLPGNAGDSLRIWVHGGGEQTIPIGRKFEYRFASDRDAYLSLLHVDAHGVVTVLYPNRAGIDSHIQAGEEKSFPPVQATPPIGREDLFLVATPSPVSLEDLGLSPGRDGFAVLEAVEGPELARRLREEIAGRGAETVAIARLQQRVVPRGAGPVLTRGEIVEAFSARTRSISRPRLDVHIHFRTDSADLDAEARRNLDEFGEALNSPELKEERFVIGGHTDDTGPDAYNLDLSRRRAESVRRYLTQTHGISDHRLTLHAYGESEPLEPGTSEAARRMNRRVEFSLAD